MQTKTDRSIVSPSIGSPYEHTAKSLVQNISKKQSVVSAFDSNYDDHDKQKIEPVTPVDVNEVGAVLKN